MKWQRARRPGDLVTVLAVLLIVFGLMLVEGRRSQRNERDLRARGAVEPDGDVYGLMQLAYPGAFAAMAVEAMWREPRVGTLFWLGVAVFGAGKALKYWAVATLGPLWTFRLLVLPDHPRVTCGPYRFMRHPNYVGVLGELLGVALLLQVPATGAIATVGFGWLLARRMALEHRALEQVWRGRASS